MNKTSLILLFVVCLAGAVLFALLLIMTRIRYKKARYALASQIQQEIRQSIRSQRNTL